MKAKRQLAILFVLPFLLLGGGYVALDWGGNPQVLLADKTTLNQEAIENALIDAQNEGVTVRFITIPSAQITPTVAFTAYLPIVMKPEPPPQPLDCNFYEPNDASEQANWIQDGETQRHCITPESDVDWVKFSVITETEVIIETSGESGDTRMWLYDESLNQIAYNDDGGVDSFSRIQRTCLATGTYYVKVDEFGNNQAIASYDITLSVNDYSCGWDAYEPDDTPDQANWIESGGTQIHSIVPIIDVDWVKFLVITETEVIIETSGNSGDTRIWLYDESLNQIAYNDDGGAELFSRIQQTCLVTGTYYAKVDESFNNSEIASYNITLTFNTCRWDTYEPNDTPEQANWIDSDKPQTHNIIPENDIDWVKFSVITESQVVLETSGQDGDTVLRLYDGDLNQLEVDDDDGVGLFSRIDRVCGSYGDSLPVGTYYASIDEGSNDAEIPSYDLTLLINECPSAVILSNHSFYTTLDFSPSLIVVGEIQNDGDVDLTSARIAANLFDNGNQLIDTDTDTVELGVLPANDKTCFLVSFDEFNGWSHFEFETPTYYSTTDNWLRNMVVYGDNGTYDPNNGSYRILGFVRNDNDIQIQSVQPIVTLYDAAGIVIGCSYAYVNSTHLDPGQSSSFELTFSGYYRDYVDVVSYRIQVDGYPQQAQIQEEN